MAWVVFLRGVNVGGHKAFRPSAVAKDLAEFDVVNVGAAGTFVVRKSISSALLRIEVTRRLPFAPDFMICRGRDVSDLGSGDPFPGSRSDKDVSWFVSSRGPRHVRLEPAPAGRADARLPQRGRRKASRCVRDHTELEHRMRNLRHPESQLVLAGPPPNNPLQPSAGIRCGVESPGVCTRRG
jgi:hypothetical protein